MFVSDQLRHLEAWLLEEHKNKKSIHELYELVQYAGADLYNYI